MNKIKIYTYLSLAIVLAVIAWFYTTKETEDEDFSERVKISLREVGHQLLLSNQDTTSLVLPIKEKTKFKYEIAFQKKLTIQPDSLVRIIQKSIQKAALPKYYRVEVYPCAIDEVVYSFEVFHKKENDIIPCRGRELPSACYLIDLKFIEKSGVNKVLVWWSIFIFLLLIIMLEVFLFKKRGKENANTSKIVAEEYTKIGSFYFYQDQNKLVKQTDEIILSKKECELLAIFAAQPNQIIKRETLTKKVWEDNGVIVGRSLDTYISKLRKKLKDDTSIKITNVHGVGYKLELDS